MSLKNILLLSAFLLIFAACGSSRKTIPVHRTLEPVSVSAKNNPLEHYRASQSLQWDIIHSRIALSFNYEEQTADGRIWIKMHPYFYETDSIILDAKSMEIHSVTLMGRNKDLDLSYRHEDDRLRIRLPEKYTRQDTLTLHITYTAQPYVSVSGGSKAITDDRGLYFINSGGVVPGKPVQIWTQGETEANSRWFPCFDQPNERMTFQLELTVPDSFTTLSNGLLVSTVNKGYNLRTDVWKMEQPVQVYALMFAVGKFSIVEDSAWNGIPIDYYVEPEYMPYARKMFQHTPEMMEFFSGITGVSYPWNKYSQIVVRDYVSGAMENTTASLFGEFMNQNFREIADKNYEDIVAHELFHQWFGDYVTAESWSNLTVNESFANYGQQLWRKYKYGPASNDEMAYNDLMQYIDQALHHDEPLVRFHYHSHEDMFDRISYQKGGAILHYLHGLTGDDAFSAAMKAYLTRNALQSAEAHHWRLAVEDVTGKDWNCFFNQWYYRGGYPELTLEYEYRDDLQQLDVKVAQQPSDGGAAYILPLKAMLLYGNEKVITDWIVDQKKQVFSFPYKEGTKPLFVPDARHWLPGVIRENKTLEEWKQQLTACGDYINKRRSVNAAFLAPKEPVAQEIFHLALKDSLEGIRAYTVKLMERVPDLYNWRKHFKEEVSFLAIQDGSNRVRASAFGVMGKWKTDNMKEEMLRAVGDSSYLVAGAALQALRAVDGDTAYQLALDMYRRDPRSDLETAVWETIAVKGHSLDLEMFAETAAKVYGKRMAAFVRTLYIYALATDDRAIFDQALRLMAEMTAREQLKSHRFAAGSVVFSLFQYYREQAASSKKPEQKQRMKERQDTAEKYKKILLQQEKDPKVIRQYSDL